MSLPDHDPAGASRSLLERASRGDALAVDALIERHLPGLRAFIRLKAGAAVRGKESCSDLVQSVCREVLEGAGRFDYRGEAAFRQWLFTTALRKIVARQRHHLAEKRDVRRERLLSPIESASRDRDLLEAYTGLHTPSRLAAAREEVERVELAIARLPEEYREVICLSRLMGLGHAEIAEQLGRSEGAVRVLLHRALARLSRLLEQPQA